MVLTAKKERQDAIREANKKYDSQRAKLEGAQGIEFVEPDAAQGFEEFMDSEEQPITKQDEINEQNDFEQLKSEIPDIEPEEAPTLVQKKKNKTVKM